MIIINLYRTGKNGQRKHLHALLFKNGAASMTDNFSKKQIDKNKDMSYCMYGFMSSCKRFSNSFFR